MLKKKRSVAVALLMALLLAALPQSGVPLAVETPTKTYQPRTLYDLHSVEELRALFNQDKGMPRLVLLVSPT